MENRGNVHKKRSLTFIEYLNRNVEDLENGIRIDITPKDAQRRSSKYEFETHETTRSIGK